MTAPFQWISIRARAAWDLLAGYPTTKKTSRAAWVGLALLFLAGAAGWGVFFHWGRYPMDYQDWLAVSAPRFFFLRSAALQGVLPLHMTEKALLGWVTTRYMAVPDAFLSPQLIFLRNLSVERFIFLDMVGMYSLGFLGLLGLRRRFRLSLAAFSLLFVLFNFNGHIVAHLSIGHETWGGYFLLPWFALLVFDLLDGDRSWGWAAKMAGLLFVILLQGSYHQYVWALFCLGFLSVARKGNFVPAVKAAVAAVLVGAVRFLPVTLEAGAFDSTYHGGFLGIGGLLQAFVNPRFPGELIASPNYYKPLGAWEFTIYIGIAAAVFLAFFGVYRWAADRRSQPRYFALAVPILGLTLLSFHGVFLLLRKIPFPMFSGERVPARIISLPFLFLLVVAVLEFQRWLDRERARPWLGLAVWAAVLGGTVYSLSQNLVAWSILQAQPLFGHEIMFYNKWVVANDYKDTAYLQALAVGAAISLAASAGLGALAWWERRRTLSMGRPAASPGALQRTSPDGNDRT